VHEPDLSSKIKVTFRFKKNKPKTILHKAPMVMHLNGFFSIFIRKRLRYFLPFNRNEDIVLQNNI
jgi:hypothetical protein